MEGYADGHRERPADPDARWGAKSKGHGSKLSAGEGAESQGNKRKRDLHWWFGYKPRCIGAVDAVYELPVSFVVTPANEADTKSRLVGTLLKKAVGDKEAVKLEAVVGDKGYDSQENCRLVYEQYGAVPIIPIRERTGMQLPDPDVSGQRQGHTYLQWRSGDGVLGSGRELPEVPPR